MKTLLFALLLVAPLAIAQPQKGEVVPNLQFSPLLNAPKPTASLSDFRGKVVLLEFWATWCGPCLEAQPHLQALQQRQADKLQVITVTDESQQRIEKFLAKRPSKLWVALDSSNALSSSFPHQLIPHTILIGPDGRLMAQTNPEAMTDAVIDSLWRGQAVHLTEKVDNLMDLPEILNAYFPATETVKYLFRMQAQIEGAPGLHTTHNDNPRFKNRRLTALNLSLSTHYRIAYGQVPYKRTIDKTGSTDDSPVYCVDLIVERPEDLFPALQRELAERFDVQARWEALPKEVNVLRITNRAKFSQIPRNASGQRTYFSRNGAIDQQAITLTDFADFLDTFGGGRLMVVDETGNTEKLDIKFTYQPEDPQSLPAVLAGMGLGLTKELRTVKMLVLER